MCLEQFLIEFTGKALEILLIREHMTSIIFEHLDPVCSIPHTRFSLEKFSVTITIPEPRYPRPLSLHRLLSSQHISEPGHHIPFLVRRPTVQGATPLHLKLLPQLLHLLFD